MKIAACILGLVVGLAAPRTQMHAQDTDLELKRAIVKGYKTWLYSSAFTCAYEMHDTAWITPQHSLEERSEIRLTLDPSTKRYLVEKIILPDANGQGRRYLFTRWDGDRMLSGFSDKSRVTVSGRPVRSLAEVPVGTPLTNFLTSRPAQPSEISNFYHDPIMIAAGFATYGMPTEQTLAKLLAEPGSPLSSPPKKDSDDLILTLDYLQVTLDVRQALIKETYDAAGHGVRRVVTRFENRLPSEVTITTGSKEALVRVDTFKALKGQCRPMSREDFEQLIKAALPPDIEVRTEELPSAALK